MKNILTLQDVRYSYNDRPVLAIDELVVARGSIMGLAGPNGSGKTTLLKVLAGIVKPTAGTVAFYPKDDTGQEAAPVRHRLSLLPQETYLLRRSVHDNIAYGLLVRGLKADIDVLVSDALALVGLPVWFSERKWHELSGGEAQRVALAARLALKPDCLMLDEPTASVDMESARNIRRAVLIAKKEWGTTLIIASHHRSWLNDICDHVVYLYNGRVIRCSYENILTGPWVAAGSSLVACTLSDGQQIYAGKPIHSDCSAVFAPNIFTLGSPPEKKWQQLWGVVSAITRENLRAELQIHVTCGDQRFIVNLPENQLRKEKAIPGQKVILSYNPHQVIWLEKK